MTRSSDDSIQEMVWRRKSSRIRVEEIASMVTEPMRSGEMITWFLMAGEGIYK
jgi:hypothetical protein